MLIALLSVSTTQADWINLTGAETAPNIAEITVFDDRVEVALEIYVGDLEIFEPLIPDDWLKNLQVERPPIEERLARFSERGLRITTETGKTLQAQLRLAEPRLRKDRYSPFAGMVNPYTSRRVPDAPGDKRVLYAELVYPFGETSPVTLTFTPPLDEAGLPPVTIGFILYHKSVPVIDFRYLSGASTLTLDPDPWYSRFDNPNLKRHHKSALMSFLYVEPYEVRHEILTRVRDLEAWMDLGLRGDEYIELDELEPLKKRIGGFMLQKNPVLVDGEALKPLLDRTNYVKVALTGIQLLEKPERLEIDTAIVGVILTYLTDGLPQQVTVDWELFTGQIDRVPATATDPAGPLPTFLTPDDSIHTWTNYLRNYRLPTVQQVAVAGSLGEFSLPAASIVLALLMLPAGIWFIRRRRQAGSTRLPVAALVTLAIAVMAHQGKEGNMRIRAFRQAIAAALLLLAGGPVFAEAKPVVYTVNYPLQYFAQRIAGDHADVIFPVPAGIDPAFWQPDAETITRFQDADLILLNGAGYAKWTGRASLPRSKLVDSSAGFRDKLIENTDRIAHSHGREGSHSHAGTAFTTWLDFSQAAAQVRTIRDALSRLHPDGRNTYTANALAL